MDVATGVVGKIDPVGSPTFVGNDFYFSGSEQLRRIRNHVVAHLAARGVMAVVGIGWMLNRSTLLPKLANWNDETNRVRIYEKR